MNSSLQQLSPVHEIVEDRAASAVASPQWTSSLDTGFILCTICGCCHQKLCHISLDWQHLWWKHRLYTGLMQWIYGENVSSITANTWEHVVLQRSVEFQSGRYQKNILQEWSMVKNLACVSFSAWNVFPINSLPTGTYQAFIRQFQADIRSSIL